LCCSRQYSRPRVEGRVIDSGGPPPTPPGSGPIRGQSLRSLVGRLLFPESQKKTWMLHFAPVFGGSWTCPSGVPCKARHLTGRQGTTSKRSASTSNLAQGAGALRSIAPGCPGRARDSGGAPDAGFQSGKIAGGHSPGRTRSGSWVSIHLKVKTPERSGNAGADPRGAEKTSDGDRPNRRSHAAWGAQGTRLHAWPIGSRLQIFGGHPWKLRAYGSRGRLVGTTLFGRSRVKKPSRETAAERISRRIRRGASRHVGRGGHHSSIANRWRGRSELIRLLGAGRLVLLR